MLRATERYICSAEVLECTGQSLTVKGLPFWFNLPSPSHYFIAGTDIRIIEYLGTADIGLLYLDRPINVGAGNHINIAHII